LLAPLGDARTLAYLTTTAEPQASTSELTPDRMLAHDVPEVDTLRNDAVRNFFARQQREEA